MVVLKNGNRDAGDPLIYLLTSLSEPAWSVAEKYRMRWKIEALFKHMKTNGFSLEAMNLGTEPRCQLLMAVAVFAYVISIREGLKTYRKVRVKQYADGSQEREESVFRHGLNSLLRFCANLITFCRHLFSEIGRNKMPVPIMILENV